MRFPGERQRVIDGLAERGVGHAHLLPGADPPPGLPAGVRARRRGPAAAGHRPPVRRGARDPRPPAALGGGPRGDRGRGPGRRDARRRPIDRAERAPMSTPAPLRVGLAGLGSMGRNHLRVIAAHPEMRGSSRSATPIPRCSPRRPRQTGAAGWSDPLAMAAEAEIDALVIAAPTTAHVPLALAAIERGLPGPRREAAGRDAGRGARDRARRRGRRGVPVQVGHVERYNPAVLELGRLLARALADHGLLDRQPPRRPVPRPHPRRRGDGRPRHPRRRHAVLDRRRAADPRLRRAGPAHARLARGPALRPAPLPVRRGRACST